jgi:hypothetical protein
MAELDVGLMIMQIKFKSAENHDKVFIAKLTLKLVTAI